MTHDFDFLCQKLSFLGGVLCLDLALGLFLGSWARNRNGPTCARVLCHQTEANLFIGTFQRPGSDQRDGSQFSLSPVPVGITKTFPFL